MYTCPNMHRCTQTHLTDMGGVSLGASWSCILGRIHCQNLQYGQKPHTLGSPLHMVWTHTILTGRNEKERYETQMWKHKLHLIYIWNVLYLYFLDTLNEVEPFNPVRPLVVKLQRHISRHSFFWKTTLSNCIARQDNRIHWLWSLKIYIFANVFFGELKVML